MNNNLKRELREYFNISNISSKKKSMGFQELNIFYEFLYNKREQILNGDYEEYIIERNSRKVNTSNILEEFLKRDYENTVLINNNNQLLVESILKEKEEIIRKKERELRYKTEAIKLKQQEKEEKKQKRLHLFYNYYILYFHQRK